MTDEELIARLRLLNEVDANVAADRIEEGNRALANLQREYNKRADRIEVLMKRLETAVYVVEESGRLRGQAEARAERLEAAIRELKRCWYQGDLTENDFAAALKGADHE